jgi:O-antigen/teichoic acid export membrane protein
MSLGRRAISASAWSLAGNGGRQLISFILFLFIARRLSPADIGLVAFAMILIDLLGFGSRLGQVEALQRRSDLSDRVRNTSFWLLVVTGTLTAVVIAGGAWLVRGVPQISVFTPVVISLAPLCALQAWNAVPEAIFKRRFDYRSLATRTWTATFVGGLVGAWLAFTGYGVYALVGQRIASALLQTIVLWSILDWRPKLEFDRGEGAGLVRSGTGIMMASLSGQLNKRIVDTITGGVLGLSELGHFRLGWRFFDFLTQFGVTPVTAVALSVFSAIKDDRARLVRTYLRLTQLVALVALPSFFGLGAIADVMVPVLLGDKWHDSIVVMQFLGLVMLGGVVNHFFAPLLIAMGKVQIVVRQSMAQIVGTAVFVFCGTYFGLVGVLVAIVTRAIMVAAYNIHALRKEVGLSPAALLSALMPPVVASAIMIAAVRFAKANLEHNVAGLELLILLIGIGAATYAAGLLAGDFVGAWRGYVRDALTTIRGALSKRRQGAALPAT